ncbi:MAG: EamA family transporter [Bryobacteraceae bacterium]
MSPTWFYLSLVVGSTVISDLLQAREMKDHGEVHDFRPNAVARTLSDLSRRRYLLLSILFMAMSFFAFLKLLAVADLSFAVPATAASYVIETALARLILKEHIGPRRIAGTLLVAGGVALLAA